MARAKATPARGVALVYSSGSPARGHAPSSPTSPWADAGGRRLRCLIPFEPIDEHLALLDRPHSTREQLPMRTSPSSANWRFVLVGRGGGEIQSIAQHRPL